MKKETEEQIEFQIKGIEILDSYLQTPRQQIPKDLAYQFNLNIEHRIDLEKKLVMVLTNVSCFVDNETGDLSRFNASCIYYLPEIEKYFDDKSANVKLPDHFIITINSISISTTRGLMFSFLRGTYLHNAVIPLIDPNAFKVEITN